MGIGSAIPRYETAALSDVKQVSELRVEETSPALPSVAHAPPLDPSVMPGVVLGRRPDLVTGRYGGVEDGRLVPDTPDGRRTFARSELSRIEVQDGSQWLGGLLVGSAIDVALVALVVAMASTSPSIGPLSAGGGWIPMR